MEDKDKLNMVSKLDLVANNFATSYFEREIYIPDIQKSLKKIYEDGFKKGAERAIQYTKQKWYYVTNDYPSNNEEVIISVKDDSGDNPYYYTTHGWRIGDIWIVNNDLLCGEVVAWTPFPEYITENQYKYSYPKG